MDATGADGTGEIVAFVRRSALMASTSETTQLLQ
jgi:hypothetical protein